MPNYKFKFVESFDSLLESDLLETNLISFLNWGFLEIGAYANIELGDTAVYGGGLLSKLKLCNDKRYNEGQVWNGLRSDWVWESGTSVSTQPINISGVYINSTFYPIGTTGIYEYYINYPLGQVIFTNPLETDDDVKVEHSYKYVQIRSADEEWFQTLMYRSQRSDDDQINGATNDILPQNRIQLPAIIVESVGNARAKALEIGSNGRIQNLDVNFYIVTESPEDRKRIHDIIINQWDTEIKTFNENDIIYPLNPFGTPVSGASIHPTLCAQHPWEVLRFIGIRSGESEQIGKNLWLMTVRGTFEFNVTS